MKLLTLNIWGGRVHEPLIKFLQKNKDQVDVFCFQEVYDSDRNLVSNEIKTNVLSEISEVLENYTVYYSPLFKNFDTKHEVDFNLSHGQAILIKKPIKLLSKGNIFVYKKFDQKVIKFYNKTYLDHPRSIEHVVVENSGKKYLVINFHGYFIPAPKKDTPQRIEQSKKILEFLNSQKLPIILCGDFNLDPDTKSMEMLEGNMVNLIKKYDVKSTRSSYYDRDNKFADYILVSKDIKVKDFKVLPDEVSDHLPLLLDFE